MCTCTTGTVLYSGLLSQHLSRPRRTIFLSPIPHSLGRSWLPQSDQDTLFSDLCHCRFLRKFYKQASDPPSPWLLPGYNSGAATTMLSPERLRAFLTCLRTSFLALCHLGALLPDHAPDGSHGSARTPLPPYRISHTEDGFPRSSHLLLDSVHRPAGWVLGLG